jgi:HEAT repeat protein
LQVPDKLAPGVKCPKCRKPLVDSAESAPAFEVVETSKPASAAPAKPKTSQKASAAPAFEVVEDVPDFEVTDDKPIKRKKAEADDEKPQRKAGKGKRKNNEAEDEDDDSNDDASDRPARRKKKAAKSSTMSTQRVLIFGGLGVGALVLLIGGFFAFRYTSGAVAFGGEWPEPKHPGMALSGPGETITFHILGVEDDAAREAIWEQLDEMGLSSGGASNLQAPRLTLQIRTKSSAEEVASKVTFGTVHSVKGNIISVYASKLEPLPTEPVAKALHNLKSKSSGRRRGAFGPLAKAQPDERRAEVLAALEPYVDDSDPGISSPAAEAYSVWAGKENVPKLLAMMNGDPVKEEARIKSSMLALARLKDERGLEPILHRLEDMFSRGDARDALVAYGLMAEPYALKALKHSDYEVRKAAIDALEKIGGKNSYDPLAECLADEKTRFPAGQVLTKLGPAAEDAVDKIVVHPDPDARARACEILCTIGTKKSLPLLEEAVKDSNFQVHTHAENAINAIKKRG